jgi:DNA invertase Pin-like site-specific DNA recombinase
MADGRFVAYYRVSTDKQGKSGLGLEAQREAVSRHLNGGQWTLSAEYTEIESGKDNSRPELHKAIRAAKLYGAKLIIAKLDRLARNVAFVSNLMESGVEFIAVDFPQANRLTIHILAAVAEHEAAMISQRTKAALAAAKARGKVLGGNRGVVIDDDARKASAAVRAAKAHDRASDIIPVIDELRGSGVTSLGAIARELTARKVPTARGLTTWTPAGVSRVLERVSAP